MQLRNREIIYVDPIKSKPSEDSDDDYMEKDEEDRLMFEEMIAEEISDEEMDRLYGEFRRMINNATSLPTMKEVLELEVDEELKQDLFVKMMKIEHEDPYTREYDVLRQEIWTDFNNFRDNNVEMMMMQKKFGKSKDSFKDRILKSNHPESVKASLYERYQYLVTLSPSDSEHAKLSNMLDTALSIPTNIKLSSFDTKSPSEILRDLKNCFDSKLFGQKGPKDELLSIVASKLLNPESTRNAIALLGPPGVGKTELARLLAKGLDLPFCQISLGGVSDSSFIDGSAYVYVGSGPGMFVNGLVKMKSKRGIFFLDEIDKMGKEEDRSLESSLHHILDSTQNSDWRDKYIPEIGIDLSQSIFVMALNSESSISGSFRDRIPIVRVCGYSYLEKKEIVNKYILPSSCRNAGLKEGDVVLSDQTIFNLDYQLYGGEKSGVRQLQEKIDRLVRHLVYYHLVGEPVSFPYIVRDFSHMKSIFQVGEDQDRWRDMYI